MAFKVTKIDPLDLQPRKAVGVLLPFSSRSVFELTYQTKDAIKVNLLNYFLTGKGERFLNPTFGNGLQNLLFEQMTQDKIISIENTIRNEVGLYFPKVKVESIGIESYPDSNLVAFRMTYSIKGTGIEDSISLELTI